MDVLWFKLPKLGADMDAGSGLMGALRGGRILVALDRFDHWQVGFVFPKGRYQQVKATEMDAMRQVIVDLEPRLAEHVKTLKDWAQLTLLSVESSFCTWWHQPGLLLIGDAAHVMSPVGGVGINYAIQDAVVAANLLVKPLLEGRLEEHQAGRGAAQAGVPYPVHSEIPGDDAETTAGTGAGLDPDNSSGAHPFPLVRAGTHAEGFTAAAHWLWGPKSACGRVADFLSGRHECTASRDGLERRHPHLASNRTRRGIDPTQGPNPGFKPARAASPAEPTAEHSRFFPAAPNPRGL
jgi:hypothetical protein